MSACTRIRLHLAPASAQTCAESGSYTAVVIPSKLAAGVSSEVSAPLRVERYGSPTKEKIELQFELRRASGAQPWYWLIRAANGQVLATSETYYNR